MIGELRVVDAHTHAFSPDLLADRERVVQQDFWFGHLYGNPAAKAVDIATVRTSSKATGIDRTVVCGFPWSDQGRCRSENAWMAESSAMDPQLDWLGIVVPGHRDAGRDAAWCLENGAVGIGELNADGQNASLLEASTWAPLIDVARSFNRPMLLHASEPLGHNYAGKGTATPDKLIDWLGRAQGIDVVLAHWGGGLAFYELMPAVRALTHRVHYDSAASTYLYRFEVFPRIVDLVGADRVIFGSDFPLLNQGRFLSRSCEALSGNPALPAVLAGNADRIYKTGSERIAP